MILLRTYLKNAGKAKDYFKIKFLHAFSWTEKGDIEVSLEVL